MSDTLIEMKKTLKERKATLADMKKEATDINSLGGKDVVALESLRIAFVEGTIKALADEITQREKDQSTCTMQGVINLYDGLLIRIRKSIDDADRAFTTWQIHILNVGTYYNHAFTTFEDTVKAQEKYDADLANIAASVLSIGGMGVLSWLSTTKILANTITNISANQANILEDVAQGLTDKIVSFSVPKVVDNIQIKPSGPLEFQNKITLKATKSYKAVAFELHKAFKTVSLCREAIVLLEIRKTGNVKEQYENYIRLEDNIGDILVKTNKWSTTSPPVIEETALTNEFERAFWAGWIPRLKNEKTRTHTGRDEFGVADPNYGETYNEVSFDTWFSSTLKNRLYALIDMKSIGVGDGGLGWVSVADVKLLIAWANKFTFTQTF